MKENGVRINDLYTESIRQGFPKAPDVHSTGNLAAKAIEAIEAALAAHPNPGKPLPRVLLIGDSITGSYQNAVMKHFEGRANVYKKTGNAEHTGTGLKHIDEWLNKITALDTRPFLRAPEVSPGTRADTYHQNAESFLLIGDAMGKAILELQQK